MPLKIKYSCIIIVIAHHHHIIIIKVITPRNYALKYFNHRLTDLVAGNRTKVFSSMLRTNVVGTQDGHLDVHTAPELCRIKTETFVKFVSTLNREWTIPSVPTAQSGHNDDDVALRPQKP